MEDKTQYFECDDCGAEFSLITSQDMVVEFCPFCGEPIEEIDWEIDDENVRRESEGGV